MLVPFQEFNHFILIICEQQDLNNGRNFEKKMGLMSQLMQQFQFKIFAPRFGLLTQLLKIFLCKLFDHRTYEVNANAFYCCQLVKIILLATLLNQCNFIILQHDFLFAILTIFLQNLVLVYVPYFFIFLHIFSLALLDSISYQKTMLSIYFLCTH